jgi:hypothetical protein
MSTNHRCSPTLESSCCNAPRPPELTAIRLSFSWFDLRRSVSADQYAQAAKTFAADPRALRFGKILLDPNHPALWAVYAMRRRILGYWKGITLPAPGFADVRFVRRADVDAFVVQMASLQAELDDALSYLDACYEDLQEQARTQLGDLYQPGDYPQSLPAHFGVAWNWPRMPMPGYLQQVSLGIVSDRHSPPAALGDDDVGW